MDTRKSRAYEEQATRCCPLRPTPLQLLLPTGWLGLVREEPQGRKTELAEGQNVRGRSVLRACP